MFYYKTSWAVSLKTKLTTIMYLKSDSPNHFRAFTWSCWLTKTVKSFYYNVFMQYMLIYTLSYPRDWLLRFALPLTLLGLWLIGPLSIHCCINILYVYAFFSSPCNWVLARMTMPHVGAIFGAIAGVMAIMLHSSIHKIEEGHLAVYYRYRTVVLYPCLKVITNMY